jgi:hypothetical protein
LDQFITRLAFGEPFVELLPDGLGQPGDFASSGHKKNVGAINRH